MLGLRGLRADPRGVTPGEAAAVARTQAWVIVPVIVLVGVLALRAAIIFSAQA